VKVGDLVKLDPSNRWLGPEEYKAIGVILQVLDGGSHRKNTSYEVLWSKEIKHGAHTYTGSGNICWHTPKRLELIK